MTRMRNILDHQEASPNPVFRMAVQLCYERCISRGALLMVTGITLRYGGMICQTQVSCLDSQLQLQIKSLTNAHQSSGIYPELPKVDRNWMGMILNRHDPWEDGIGAIPCIYMGRLEHHLTCAVTMGSYRYLEAIMNYLCKVRCDLKDPSLDRILYVGIGILDLRSIQFAIQQVPRKKETALQMIRQKEPIDRNAQQDLQYMLDTVRRDDFHYMDLSQLGRKDQGVRQVSEKHVRWNEQVEISN